MLKLCDNDHMQLAKGSTRCRKGRLRWGSLGITEYARDRERDKPLVRRLARMSAIRDMRLFEMRMYKVRDQSA